MKRKYITLLSLSIMLVCQTSCSDFFDQMPTDRLTYNDLFESKASTEKALATVYVYLPDEFAQRLAADGRHTTPGIWTAGCDEAEYYWDFVPSHLVNNNTITPKSSIVSSYWEKYYAGISAAGRFIQGAPQCKDMEQNLLAQWIEEARALRAMYYFYLLRIYGPIPILSDDPISMDAPLEKVQLPRNSVEECVEYIVSEFDKVLDSGCLPEKSLTYNCGRIDNSIVMAFKAEVLQYAASDLYNGKNSFVAQLRNKDGKKLFPEDISDEAVKAKWRRAATASKAFIDRFVPGNYDLTKVYTNGVLNAYLSCRDAVRGEDFTNTEMIFYRINTDYSLMQYDRTPRHTGAVGSGYRASGGLGASQQMVDAFFMANGKLPISGYTDNGKTPVLNPNTGYEDSGFSSESYVDETGTILAPNGVLKAWVGREPRFYVNITFSGQKWLNTEEGAFYSDFSYDGNSGLHGGECPPTGYCVRKNAPLGAWNTGKQICIMLRLAQVYLNYVEALNECEPTHADILTYLNLIRERAGIPTYGSKVGQLPVPSTQNEMREAIRAERRVELAFESSRYFDVRRWGIAEETENMPLYGMYVNGNGNDFYKRTWFENRIFEKKMYFFPIPQGDIDIDKELVQNPGWSADV
jgi:hypothetical protein